MTPAPLGMPSQAYYLNGRDDAKLLGYQNWIKNMAVLLGADKNNVEQEITDLVDFEISLAKVIIFVTFLFCNLNFYIFGQILHNT